MSLFICPIHLITQVGQIPPAAPGGGGKNPNFFVYAWILMGIKQKLVVMVP
jgi:hypothetical protein